MSGQRRMMKQWGQSAGLLRLTLQGRGGWWLGLFVIMCWDLARYQAAVKPFSLAGV